MTPDSQPFAKLQAVFRTSEIYCDDRFSVDQIREEARLVVANGVLDLAGLMYQTSDEINDFFGAGTAINADPDHYSRVQPLEAKIFLSTCWKGVIGRSIRLKSANQSADWVGELLDAIDQEMTKPAMTRRHINATVSVGI